MSCKLGTWLIWSLAILYIQNTEATVFYICPSVQRDFYPGVARQNSSPPYVLKVTDEDGRPLPGLTYHGGELTFNVSLSAKRTGNGTEKFVGFMIYIYNEFEDEPSGHFVTPLPEGVKKEKCHYKYPYHLNEVAMNSTFKEWTDLQIQWKSPKKYPAGKIHIRASVIKEHGVYWDGIDVTLNYACAVPDILPGSCPPHYVKTKFCPKVVFGECGGVAAITVQFSSLLLTAIALTYNFM